ncbi:MAG: hypothetical protein WAV78_16250, partial [Xanthobacteraceae bacterium]
SALVVTSKMCKARARLFTQPALIETVDSVDHVAHVFAHWEVPLPGLIKLGQVTELPRSESRHSLVGARLDGKYRCGDFDSSR